MSEAWKKVKKVFDNKEKLWTLSEGKKKTQFELIGFFNRYITIKTSRGKMRIIYQQEIENSYEYLIKNGEITRNEIHEKFSPRNPAYIAAIIANFEDVTHVAKPIITLHFVRD